MRDAAGLGRIGVLMGGPSSEREISLRSGRAVAEALRARDLNVAEVEIPQRSGDSKAWLDGVRSLLAAPPLSSAFIALHGEFGEDGQVQSLLESLGIAYTGSGPAASARAFDKVVARHLVSAKGILVPRAQTFKRGEPVPVDGPYPLVVKPARQGSSLGLSIVDDPQGLTAALEVAFRYDERVLIEEYVAGREVTVGILNDRALPVVEIRPRRRFYDYRAKYEAGLTDFVVPAPWSSDDTERIQATALAAHHAIGCRAFSRVDMIVTPEGRPIVLEVNAIPGLTSKSLLPMAAKAAGLEFGDLCVEMLGSAQEASGVRAPAPPFETPHRGVSHSTPLLARPAGTLAARTGDVSLGARTPSLERWGGE